MCLRMSSTDKELSELHCFGPTSAQWLVPSYMLGGPFARGNHNIVVVGVTFLVSWLSRQLQPRHRWFDVAIVVRIPPLVCKAKSLLYDVFGASTIWAALPFCGIELGDGGAWAGTRCEHVHVLVLLVGSFGL